MALPPSMRIRGHRCFSRLHRTGRRHHGVWMVLRVMNEEASSCTELQREASYGYRALVISNKVSKRSVRRNKLRRCSISICVNDWNSARIWRGAGF